MSDATRSTAKGARLPKWQFPATCKTSDYSANTTWAGNRDPVATMPNVSGVRKANGLWLPRKAV